VSETDEDDDLEFQQADAGLLFRAEMWATNAFLGYWQYLLAGIVVILLGFLLWGQYTASVVSSQRGASQRIEQALGDLPSLDRIGPSRVFGQPLPDDADLPKSAKMLEEIAADSAGAARIEALMKAAELYRLEGQPKDQRRALIAAEGDAKGVLAFGVQSSLANLDLEEGDGESAVERLRDLAERDDVLGEHASLDLGRVLETLDRDEEAREVYDAFETRWPESSRLDEVRERKKALAG